MNLSARTVEMHRAHILRKLDVGNIAAALLMAERAGLIKA
jgi:DNA-binding CsgD family transcriptional regulator